MQIIDINDIERNSYNNEQAFAMLKDLLKSVANGTEIAILKYNDYNGNQTNLVLAPMTLLKIELK